MYIKFIKKLRFLTYVAKNDEKYDRMVCIIN